MIILHVVANLDIKVAYIPKKVASLIFSLIGHWSPARLVPCRWLRAMLKSMYFLAEGQEIKGRQSSLGNISQMREILTPGGRRTRLQEIAEFQQNCGGVPPKSGELTPLYKLPTFHYMDKVQLQGHHSPHWPKICPIPNGKKGCIFPILCW